MQYTFSDLFTCVRKIKPDPLPMNADERVAPGDERSSFFLPFSPLTYENERLYDTSMHTHICMIYEAKSVSCGHTELYIWSTTIMRIMHAVPAKMNECSFPSSQIVLFFFFWSQYNFSTKKSRRKEMPKSLFLLSDFSLEKLFFPLLHKIKREKKVLDIFCLVKRHPEKKKC